MKQSWPIPYAIAVAAVLVAILFKIPALYMLSKPLLMITLLVYFLSASAGYAGWRKLVVLAMVFSWLGDVFLLMDNMFVAGLGTFLMAHVFYIIVYHKTGAAKGQLRPFDLVAVRAFVLQKSAWFCSGEMTGADILLSFPIEAVATRTDLKENYAALNAFRMHIKTLPAYQRAIEKGGPYAY